MSERGSRNARAGSCGRRAGRTRDGGDSGRRGFSLIEVVVAIMILTIGILGLAASAGQVTKMTGWGQRFGGSAVVAGSQLELLRATPCASLANGSTTVGRYTVTWTVTVTGASGTMRDMTVRVTYPNGRTTRTDVYESYRSCV